MEPLRASSTPAAGARELRPVEIGVLREAVRSQSERTRKESSRITLGVAIGVLASSVFWIVVVVGLVL